MLCCLPMHFETGQNFRVAFKNAVRKSCEKYTFYFINKIYHTRFVMDDGTEIQLHFERGDVSKVLVYFLNHSKQFTTSQIAMCIKEATINIYPPHRFRIKIVGSKQKQILDDGFYFNDSSIEYGWCEFIIRYEYYKDKDEQYDDDDDEEEEDVVKFRFKCMSDKTLTNISNAIGTLKMLQRFRSEPKFIICSENALGGQTPIYDSNIPLSYIYTPDLTLVISNIPIPELLVF
jgi:hypothetical protein